MRYVHCLGPYITWLMGITLFSVSANTYFPKTEQIKLHTEDSLYCRFQPESEISKVELLVPEAQKNSTDQKRALKIIFKDSSNNDHKTFDCYNDNENYRCEWTAYNYLTIAFKGRKLVESDKTGGEFIGKWHHNAFDLEGEKIFCYQF